MDKDDIDAPEMDARQQDNAPSDSDENKIEDDQKEQPEPTAIVDWASI